MTTVLKAWAAQGEVGDVIAALSFKDAKAFLEGFPADPGVRQTNLAKYDECFRRN